MEHEQRSYRQVGFVDEIRAGLFEAVKRLARLDVASKTFGTELNEMAAVYAHPLATATGRLHVLRRDKSEIGDHEVFS